MALGGRAARALPLLAHKDAKTLVRVLRLWGIVLVTNVVGTLAFAFVVRETGIFPHAVKDAFAAIGREAMSGGFGSHFVRAVFSGWLIALMTWMLPGANARAFIVVTISYIIGVGQLSHVIAGSTEALYAVFDGDSSILGYLGRFLVPVGLGNMVGGIALVAALSHAQIAADAKS